MEETIWDGLACPPMDDYAFDFTDVNCAGGRNLDPDVFFDEPFGEKKTTMQTIIKKYGKGKELKKLAVVLKQDIDPVAYSKALVLELAALDKEKIATSNNVGDQEKVTSCNKTQSTVIQRKIPQAPPMKLEKKVITRPEIITSDHHQGCVTKKVLPKPVAYSKALAREKADLDKEKAVSTSCPAADKLVSLWNKTQSMQPVTVRNREVVETKMKIGTVSMRTPQPPPIKQEKLHIRPEIITSDHCQGYCTKKVLTKQDEEDHALKLDATKRKLRVSYEQINNYKKQRSIQLIEFQHLPPMSKPIIQKQKPKAKPKLGAVRNTWSSRLVKSLTRFY